MSVAVNVTSVTARVYLSNGNKSDGSPKYESFSLGTINKEAANLDEKIKDIGYGLQRILNLNIYRVMRTEHAYLTTE